ncbi:MAG: ABC transporter ATP-binding protein [Pseudomonadales bacterium]
MTTNVASIIHASQLSKRYGSVAALDGFDLVVEPGHIVGLIGPNGSGKTTALKAILGLTRLDGGSLRVNGLQPWRQRAALMRDVAYIPDTGILPRWMKVRDLLNFVEGVHAGFSRDKAERMLARTDIQRDRPVGVLSKGMQVQLHLALILAIQARLLVLDEPTLGLDILYREQFYDTLLNDYFEDGRSILVTTHEVREIEHVLTDVVLIARGKARLTSSMDGLREDFVKLTTTTPAAAPDGWLTKRQTLAGTEYLYRNAERAALAPVGSVSTPNLAELFVAIMEKPDA